MTEKKIIKFVYMHNYEIYKRLIS